MSISDEHIRIFILFKDAPRLISVSLVSIFDIDRKGKDQVKRRTRREDRLPPYIVP